MAGHHYYLKDKKVQFWKGESEYVLGRPVTTYSLAFPDKLWAYYRQISGNVTIEGSAIKYYDTSEKAVFVINRRSDFMPNTLMLLIYNKKIYEIKNVDDYEGYLHDLKITAELATNQDPASYNGLVIE